MAQEFVLVFVRNKMYGRRYTGPRGRGWYKKTSAPQARYSLRGFSVSGIMTERQPILYLKTDSRRLFFCELLFSAYVISVACSNNKFAKDAKSAVDAGFGETHRAVYSPVAAAAG
jgi:hypothetical protein